MKGDVSSEDTLTYKDTRFIWFVVITIFTNVVLFLIVGSIGKMALDRANDNTTRIIVTQYNFCVGLNQGFSRQNAVIDEAIIREQKKANPNKKSIRDLNRFKLPIRDCGVKP